MPKFLLSLALFLTTITCYSQKYTLNGILTNGQKLPVSNSVIALLTPKDSILYRFVRSDKEGKFEIKNHY